MLTVTEHVSVDFLSEPQFNPRIIENLVMSPRRLASLKALVKSFDRKTKDGTTVTTPFWSADFVAGKGRGLIFLLHGRPGSGKTCTAGEIVITKFCKAELN
jgi:Cdc6-like AAA superfamily ATPase